MKLIPLPDKNYSDFITIIDSNSGEKVENAIITNTKKISPTSAIFTIEIEVDVEDIKNLKQEYKNKYFGENINLIEYINI